MARVLRALARPLALLICRSKPFGSCAWKLSKPLPSLSGMGVRPRARSSASTVFAFHGSITQQMVSTVAWRVPALV